VSKIIAVRLINADKARVWYADGSSQPLRKSAYFWESLVGMTLAELGNDTWYRHDCELCQRITWTRGADWHCDGCNADYVGDLQTLGLQHRLFEENVWL